MSHCQTVEELRDHIAAFDTRMRKAVDDGTILGLMQQFDVTLVSTSHAAIHP